MPNYEYRCQKCEHQFTDLLRIDDRKKPTEEACPNCKEVGQVEQFIGSAPNLIAPASMYKPKLDFKERMRQIKQGMHGSSASKNIKDY